MLGVILGLRSGIEKRDLKLMGLWASALMVYPIWMLLVDGFLSFGAIAVIIVGSALVVFIRNHRWVIVSGVAIAILGLSLFVNYFQHRKEIRDAVWGGAPLAERIDASLSIFREFEWFDTDNGQHLIALDERLNQNYFVGVAAERIDRREVDYIHGQSIWDGVLSLVPRALWPDKPVAAGSGDIVRDLTGLELSETTSWGVGQVMEFYINLGMPGLVVGFFVLGWLLGMLDRKAAAAERSGDLGRVFLFFLPGVALIQPNGSLVELTGGAGAALGAAYAWKWIWEEWMRRQTGPYRTQRRGIRQNVPR